MDFVGRESRSKTAIPSVLEPRLTLSLQRLVLEIEEERQPDVKVGSRSDALVVCVVDRDDGVGCDDQVLCRADLDRWQGGPLVAVTEIGS